MEPRILLLGGSSAVGQAISERLGPTRSQATYLTRPVAGGWYFDSTKMNLRELLEAKEEDSFSHAVVLLGDTRPDSCAEKLKESRHLNVTSIRGVIDALLALRIKPVFVSSDSVFDGKKGRYEESDRPVPVLTYGRQKLEIENYLASETDDFLIVRLSKVYGLSPGDGTLFTTWLSQLESGEDIRVAQDQIFSPVLFRDVAQVFDLLIQKNCTGVYHVGGPSALSRLDLLRMLVGRLEGRMEIRSKILPCSINDFSILEPRPLNVSLSAERLTRTLGIRLTTPEESCQTIVERWA